jgi:hypothetical protein
MPGPPLAVNQFGAGHAGVKRDEQPGNAIVGRRRHHRRRCSYRFPRHGRGIRFTDALLSISPPPSPSRCRPRRCTRHWEYPHFSVSNFWACTASIGWQEGQAINGMV